MTRETIKLAAVLTIVLFTGCGDDDAPDKDSGADSGSPNSGGGKAGADGGSKDGSGGSNSTGGPGSGDEVDSGSEGPSSGTDASVDAGSSSDGGGSMDAAAADGGGMHTAPGCGGLLECCAALPDMEQMNCKLIANNADDATCDQFKPILCPSASADGGVVDAQACMTLDDCCESLPLGPARVACATTVTNAVALDCQQVMQAFCPSGGNPNACTALTECCAGLPPPRRNSCNTVVDQGLPAGCEALLTALCP